MIDRLVHHAEILALKGDSYRLRDKDLDARPAPNPPKSADRSPAAHPSQAPRRAYSAPILEPALVKRRPRGRKAGSALRASPSSRPRPDPHNPARPVHLSTGASGPPFDRP